MELRRHKIIWPGYEGTFSNLNLGYFFGFCMTFFQSVVNLFQRRWFYLLFYLVRVWLQILPGNKTVFPEHLQRLFLFIGLVFLRLFFDYK